MQHFAYAGSVFRDLHGSKSESDLVSLECLECKPQNCEFTRTSEDEIVCSCPLRNHMVRNFDIFIFDSVDRIKGKNCKF